MEQNRCFANPIVSTFNDERDRVSLFLAIGYFPLMFFALSLESAASREVYGEMRWLLDLIMMIYCALMLLCARAQLRQLMMIMVPLSFIGEVLFCELCGLYSYRTDFIPIYVPFGHAVVYASGYLLTQQNWCGQHRDLLKSIFTVFYTLLFLGVGVVGGDRFTLILGSLFFGVLRRKQWDNLYFIVGLCALWVELVGTQFGCWQWSPLSFGVIPAANPPLGVVFFYAGGDAVLSKVDRLVTRWRQQSRSSTSVLENTTTVTPCD